MAITKHNAMQFQFSFVHNNDFSILTKHNAYQSSGPSCAIPYRYKTQFKLKVLICNSSIKEYNKWVMIPINLQTTKIKIPKQ